MKTVKERLEAIKPEITAMVKDMHDNPELGHACGDNMIAGVACGAAIALKDAVDEYGGEGAAACTGTTVKITNFENPYDNMMSNDIMSERATEYLYEQGIPRGMKRVDISGSSDVGSVSQKRPTIHAWFCATDGNENIKVHTPDFPPCTISEAGTEAMMIQTAALVKTGEDVLSDLRSWQQPLQNMKEN